MVRNVGRSPQEQREFQVKQSWPRNESFRDYADCMATDECREGVRKLVGEAEQKRTAITESLFWRCHRRLISDYLLATGITVQHIMPSGGPRPHTLTSGPKVEGVEVTYPPRESQGVHCSVAE